MPIIHPAAGLHSTEFQGTIAWDFEQLGKLLRGDTVRWAVEDGHPDPDYGETVICGSLDDVAAVDTEGSSSRPWCASWSSTEGSSRCIRTTSGLKFQHIVLHNAMHDIGVLRSMSAKYKSFDDTMIMAYLLCVEPQGLKALAKRHCGMEMNDYSELVAEPSKRKAYNYLHLVISECLSKLLNNESNVSSLIQRSAKKLTRASAGRKLGKISRTKRPASRRR